MQKSNVWERIHGNFITFLLLSGVFLAYFSRTPIHPSQLEGDPEERIQCWVFSAQAMQQRHAFLCVIGPDHLLHPVEMCTSADDRGHVIAANLFAAFKQNPFNQMDLVRINVGINVLGVWVLAAALWFFGMPFAAVCCIALSKLYVIPGPIPGMDVPSAYPGIVSLALVPILWTTQSFLREENDNASFQWDFLFGYLALGTAYLFRSPIGLLSLIVCEGTLLCRHVLLPLPDRKRLSRYLAAVLALATITLWTPLLLATRNRVYHLKPSLFYGTHGVSQTLFHGLGTESNSLGIRWDDLFGYEYVHRIDPSAAYLSPTYYGIMRRAYISTVLHHPIEVLRIYGIKLKKVLSLPLRWGGVPIYLYVLFMIIMVCVFWRRAKGPGRASLYAIAGTLGFLGLFMLQGVFGIPWIKHLYPVKWIVVIGNCCLADFLLGHYSHVYRQTIAPRADRSI